jgi:hypothetical protein
MIEIARKEKLPGIAADYVDHLVAEGNIERAKNYTDLFLFYERVRNDVISMYLDGDPGNVLEPNVPAGIKETYQRHSSGVVRLLGEAMEKLPIYKKMAKEYETLNFLRDDKGRFTDIVNGWYQNSSGDLFHYDGIVWDKVPSERVSNLEFLGK